jgi:putative transposase
MKRVPPSVRLKEEINGLLQGAEPNAAPAEPPMVGFVGRLARYMLQVAIEAEATAFLGREHYRRGARQRVGWRNGYESKHVQSEAGLLELAVPQLRGTEEPFQPQVPERLQTRTADLESLVRGMYVRGLSTQDVSALYATTFGGSRLSKSTVSRVTQQLNQDFETWRRRDLSELPVVYVFLDGQYHAARQGTDEKEGVLSAYALLDDGRPVLLHLDLGPRESYDAWLSFLQDLVGRGLRAPLLVVMDGAAGLVKAVKRVWPHAYRQRCRPQDAKHPVQTAATDAGEDERAGAAGVPRAELRGGDQAGMRPHRQVQGPLSGRDGMLRTRPRRVRHLSALSGSASSPNSDDESARAPERRRAAPNEGDSPIPDGTLVPDAALCQPHGGVDTVARNSHDGSDASPARATPSGGNAGTEGSGCLKRGGGYQYLQAFTGELGLDRGRSDVGHGA